MSNPEDKEAAGPAAEPAADPAEAPPVATTPIAAPSPGDAGWPRRRRWPLLAVLLVAALALAAGYYGAGVRFARVIDARYGELAARLDALEAERVGDALDALTRRVALLDQAAVPAAAPDLAPLAARLDAAELALASLSAELEARAAATPAAGSDIEPRLAALESAQGEGALPTDITWLHRRADELEGALGTVDERLAALDGRLTALAGALAAAPVPALVVAIGQLREALAGPRPFAAELEALRSLAEDDAATSALAAAVAQRAATGVPTFDDLRVRFAAVIVATLTPEPGAEAPWYRRALDRLSGLVVIRRVGDAVEGDGPEARLARAESRLAAGDLAGAVAQLEPLRDGAPEALVAWLDDALARLDADQARAALGARAAALAAAPAGG